MDGVLKMELINKFFLYVKRIFFSIYDNSISKFVFYKIIDINENELYVLQCVNSKSIFQANISEIIFDTDILYGLHPIQSCFIGMEYAKYLKNNTPNGKPYLKNIDAIKNRSPYNYGSLKLKYQNRKKDFCYIDCNTNEEFIMSPKDIAFSDHIINKFHSEQAFYIGVCAGLNIHGLSNNVIYLDGANNACHTNIY